MRFQSAQVQRPDFWQVSGHSYTAGAVGTADQSGRFDALFRSAMDCEYSNARNHSIYGSLLVMENRIKGGWCNVFYQHNPKRLAFPWASDGGAKLFCYGINDLGTLGTASMAQMTAAYVHAVRSCVSRARASAVFGSTSTTFTAYGAGFSSQGTPEFTDGNTRQATTTTNATITITIPAGYNGEPISVCFLGMAANAGIITFSGSAGVTGTMDLSNIMPAASFSRVPMVKRVTNLTAANIGQTIIATATTALGNMWFDSWWIEATDPPVVLWCNINRLTAAGYTTGFAANWTGTEAQKDADVDQANQKVAAVLAEFDDMVQEIPLDSVVRKDATLTSDGIHLNEAGSLKAVDAMVQAYSLCSPPPRKGDSIGSLVGPAQRLGGLIRPRVSTHWYTADCQGINNTAYTLVSGEIFAMPFMVTDARARFTPLQAECSTLGTTGSTIYLGVYNDTNYRGYPQFLEFPMSSIAVGATSGAKTSAAVTWVPDPGLYWLVFKAATVVATAAQFRAIVGPSAFMPTLATTGLALSATTNPVAWKVTGQGTGILPDVFPAGAALVDSAPFVAAKMV